MYTEETIFDLNSPDININNSAVPPPDVIRNYSDTQGSGSNSVKFAGLTDPSITVGSSSTNNETNVNRIFGPTQAVGELVYDFEVTSNSKLTGEVAVSIVASGIVTVSNSSSSAVIEIILPDLNFANSAAQVEAGNRTGLLTNVLSYNQTILVPINTPESIVIEAGTVAGWPDNNPSTVRANAYAFIDPQISIDPSVIDPSGYSIEFSANLPPNPAVPSNPGAVPEPSTYGLLAGAALLGMAGFRRRRLSTIRAN